MIKSGAFSGGDEIYTASIWERENSPTSSLAKIPIAWLSSTHLMSNPRGLERRNQKSGIENIYDLKSEENQNADNQFENSCFNTLLYKFPLIIRTKNVTRKNATVKYQLYLVVLHHTSCTNSARLGRNCQWWQVKMAVPWGRFHAKNPVFISKILSFATRGMGRVSVSSACASTVC